MSGASVMSVTLHDLGLRFDEWMREVVREVVLEELGAAQSDVDDDAKRAPAAQADADDETQTESESESEDEAEADAKFKTPPPKKRSANPTPPPAPLRPPRPPRPGHARRRTTRSGRVAGRVMLLPFRHEAEKTDKTDKTDKTAVSKRRRLFTSPPRVRVGAGALNEIRYWAVKCDEGGKPLSTVHTREGCCRANFAVKTDNVDVGNASFCQFCERAQSQSADQ